jgi:hypothetical protein
LGLLVWVDYLDLRQAAQQFEHGVDESRRYENGQMLLENLVALVEIAYRSNDYPAMEQLASEMRAEIQNRQLNYPLLEGRLERILAEAAFDQADYDDALAHYLKALPLIAEHGGYAQYRLSNELLDLGNLLDNIPMPVAISWCDAMQAEWTPLDVSHTSPELLDLCNKRLATARARQEEEKE